MKLSVITVCMNAQDTIAEAVQSVHRQSHGEVEHIVVDGGSTDRTLSVLEQHRDGIARLVSESDSGLYDAMNKGIAMATGDYVGFLNADDAYAHDHVLELVADAFDRASCDAAYGDLVYVDARDTSSVLRYWRSSSFRKGLLQAGWIPPHPTLFVRTLLLRELGGFDTRLRYQSDVKFMLRLFHRDSVTSHYIPEVLVRMRTGGHSNSSLRNIVLGNLEAYRAARELGIAKSPIWVARKFLHRSRQFFLRPRND